MSRRSLVMQLLLDSSSSSSDDDELIVATAILMHKHHELMNAPRPGGSVPGRQVKLSMMDQTNAATSLDPRAKASLVLGGESFTISSESGILSEQLAAMKEKSMVILKDYITKHNAPNDVPDESIKSSSDDEGEPLAKNPPKKSKKEK